MFKKLYPWILTNRLVNKLFEEKKYHSWYGGDFYVLSYLEHRSTDYLVKVFVCSWESFLKRFVFHPMTLGKAHDMTLPIVGGHQPILSTQIQSYVFSSFWITVKSYI